MLILKELRANENWVELIEFAETGVFTSDVIDVMLRNEVGYLNFLVKTFALEEDDDMFYSVASFNVIFVYTLLSNRNCGSSTKEWVVDNVLVEDIIDFLRLSGV